MDITDKKPNNKLKRQRALRGWSQKKVGLSIGTSKDMVSRWETGERETSLYYQEKLCVLFGLSSVDLGFIDSSADDNLVLHSFVKPQSMSLEGFSGIDNVFTSFSISSDSRDKAFQLFTKAISPSILKVIQELGRDDMSIVRREFLNLAGTSLVLSGLGTDRNSFIANMFYDDHIQLLENEITTRWNLYHTGGTILANRGLDMWISEVEKFSQEADNGVQKNRAHALLSMSYQLQGSILRDKMNYDQAHDFYKKAFFAADEVSDLELKSSTLGRRGVTFIQQKKPIEAIEYLESGLAVIDNLHLPYLKGYILQALSEAHAMAQHASQSKKSIALAEDALGSKKEVVERSLCQFNTTSITAQKGVNAVLLHEYPLAINLLNEGLASYDQRLLRGRARLIAQKAEAYYGLHLIEESALTAKEAFSIASTIGSQKTIDRVQILHMDLAQSPYKKESSVLQLEKLLSTTTTQSFP